MAQTRRVQSIVAEKAQTIMAEESWWLECEEADQVASSQEAERGECWCSANCPHFLQLSTRPQMMDRTTHT